jgi:hypothetical protein
MGIRSIKDPKDKFKISDGLFFVLFLISAILLITWIWHKVLPDTSSVPIYHHHINHYSRVYTDPDDLEAIYAWDRYELSWYYYDTTGGWQRMNGPPVVSKLIPTNRVVQESPDDDGIISQPEDEDKISPEADIKTPDER